MVSCFFCFSYLFQALFQTSSNTYFTHLVGHETRKVLETVTRRNHWESPKLRTADILTSAHLEGDTNRQTKSDSDTQDKQTHGHGTARHETAQENKQDTQHERAQGDAETDRQTRRHAIRPSLLPPSSFTRIFPSNTTPQRRRETMTLIKKKKKVFSAPELGHHPPSDHSVPFVPVSIAIAAPRPSKRSKASLSSSDYVNVAWIVPLREIQMQFSNE